MLRTSSYVIYVDLPEDSERMLLVHGYTGAYDLVSRSVARYLHAHERKRPPKPLFAAWKNDKVGERVRRPSDATIDALRRRGYLTPISFEEEEELLCRIAGRVHDAAKNPGYIFITNYDCNLRCPYCFQSYMRQDPSFRSLLGTMRPTMVDRIFAAIPKIEEACGIDSAKARHRSYGFFGGEPFLRTARPVVDHIFHRAEELGTFNCYAITNATEIDAYEDLLGPEGISFVQITLDGAPTEHDQRRAYADGGGSFARIADNIDLALARRTVVSVRWNVDQNNLDEMIPLAQEIQRRGWPEQENFRCYMAPIFADNDQTDSASTFQTWQLLQLLESRPDLAPALEVIEPPDRGMRTQAYGIFARQEGASPSLKASFCGANNAMHLFDAFGNIYPCWERLAEPRHRIGRVGPDGELLLEREVCEKWRSRNITTNAACRRCRYALYCGGGCAMEAEARAGKFFINACDGFRERFRSAVARSYQDFVSGTSPEVFHDGGCAH